MSTGYDWTEAHSGHDIIDVSMSWGSRMECDTCRKTLSVTNEEGDVLWHEGDSLADLRHYLRGRHTYEDPGPRPELNHPAVSTRYWDKP